jgi:hypothetical protein
MEENSMTRNYGGGSIGRGIIEKESLRREASGLGGSRRLPETPGGQGAPGGSRRLQTTKNDTFLC